MLFTERELKLDEIASYNRRRWDALGAISGKLTRPDLDITPDAARERFEKSGLLGPVAGRNVLCLACGGGHQSCAFAMLGAQVTVVDSSASQLKSDLAAAEHYGVTVEVVQADMRDLSALKESAFDIVYQPYSINFVPDCTQVFAQVRRVIRTDGIYQLVVANPFTLGITSKDWDGRGYCLHSRYEQGAKLVLDDEDWFYGGATGNRASVPRAIEYRQTLATVINGLCGRGFVLQHLEEELLWAGEGDPGTFNHMKAFAPPWLTLWLRADPARGSLEERQ
jgi:SAM-dependent methyltransferase